MMNMKDGKQKKNILLLTLIICLFISLISVVFIGEKKYKIISQNLKKQDIVAISNINSEALVNKKTADTQVIINLEWKNKLWSSMGDSITAQNLWQPLVSSEFGLINKNFGITATSIADMTGNANSMCRDERINALDISSDLITVMGGTNDWFNNVPLGTIKDTSVKTFYGAVNTMVKKLKTRFPNKKIILMSTPFAKYSNKKGWTDTNGLKNNLGLTSSDYGKAIIEVGRLNDITVADIHGNAGWDDKNISTFSNDQGGGIYILPNESGAKKISDILITTLKGI
jgi:hypothetical protein